jgi:hypothetical protein
LERLSYAIRIWIIDAETTDSFMRALTQGKFDAADSIKRLSAVVDAQIESSDEVFALLRGDWNAADRIRMTVQ